MHHRIPIVAVVLAAVLGVTMSSAWAFDESKYPDWKGRWVRTDTGTPATIRASPRVADRRHR